MTITEAILELIRLLRIHGDIDIRIQVARYHPDSDQDFQLLLWEVSMTTIFIALVAFIVGLVIGTYVEAVQHEEAGCRCGGCSCHPDDFDDVELCPDDKCEMVDDGVGLPRCRICGFY